MRGHPLWPWEDTLCVLERTPSVSLRGHPLWPWEDTLCDLERTPSVSLRGHPLWPWEDTLGVLSSSFKGICDEGTPVMKGHLWWRDTCDEGTPVMKGHLWWRDTCDEGTPVMKGHLWWRDTCDEGTPVMKGHLSYSYTFSVILRCPLKTGFTVIRMTLLDTYVGVEVKEPTEDEKHSGSDHPRRFNHISILLHSELGRR